MDFDFHDNPIASTLIPLGIVLLIGISYVFKRTFRQHISAVLFVVFFVYSSVSSVLFQMFACERLEDQVYYLRADYSIDCESTRHSTLQVYSAFMISVYPLGIPLFFLVSLRKDKCCIDERSVEESYSSTLWRPYRTGYWYWEIVECFRRLLLTGVLVFIYPDTSAQVAIALRLTLFFTVSITLIFSLRFEVGSGAESGRSHNSFPKRPPGVAPEGGHHGRK